MIYRSPEPDVEIPKSASGKILGRALRDAHSAAAA
jgi:acyl-coenzyme A synthetase/AMP-(fatty) acid ligase